MRWRSSTEWPRPICLKRNGAEALLLTGCMYEVGRQLLERGHADRPDGIFEGLSRKTAPLPAYIGLGEC